MNGFMELVKGRRTVRDYDSREVPDGVLKELIEAARWAPSWANSQCLEIVVIHDERTKKKLQDTVSEANPAYRAIVEAPVLIALCGKLGVSGFSRGEARTRFGDWFMFDLGIVAQNICLAAHSLGLGTVIVGMLDHGGAKEILAVPAGYELVALIPLGYPAEQPSPPERRKARHFTHRNAF